MRLVKVTWTDSGLHLSEGWAPVAEYVAKAVGTNMKVETVGFLCHDDDGIVAVGLSHDIAHDTFYGVQVILRSNVLSIEDLHEVHIGSYGAGEARPFA